MLYDKEFGRFYQAGWRDRTAKKPMNSKYTQMKISKDKYERTVSAAYEAGYMANLRQKRRRENAKVSIGLRIPKSMKAAIKATGIGITNFIIDAIQKKLDAE